MVTVQELSQSLGSVTKYTLSEQVAVILKRFILEERLKEGDRLPSERDLVNALGVSHRVLREALGALTGEGLVVKRHGLGTFVQPFDRQRLLAELANAPVEFPNAADLHQARLAIECGAAYVAAQRATAADVAALQAHITALEDASAQDSSPVAADLGFHQALLRATHNETLQSLSYLIAESVRLFNVWSHPAGLHRKIQDLAHIIDAHQAIVDAIQEQDPVKASQTMYAHLSKSLSKR